MITEGVFSHLPAGRRTQLTSLYASIAEMARVNHASDEATASLNSLTLPLDLDDVSRISFVQQIEQQKQRLHLGAIYGRTLMRYADGIGIRPSKQDIAEMLAESGTVRICRKLGLR